MTQFFRIAFVAAALLVFTGTAHANEITGFGPSFMNKAPAALGEAESDPVVAVQDPATDEFNPENLNEIAPAAGGDVIDPTAPVVKDDTVPALAPVSEDAETPDVE